MRAVALLWLSSLGLPSYAGSCSLLHEIDYATGEAVVAGEPDDGAPRFLRLKLHQWVYEAGQIKRVKLEPPLPAPCHGPNCRSQQQREQQTMPPVAPTQLRTIHDCIDAHAVELTECNANRGVLILENLLPVAGHPVSSEYPP